MNTTNPNAVAPAAGRGTLTRLTDPRRPSGRNGPLARARDARRGLRPRTERFAHLKRMYD